MGEWIIPQELDGYYEIIDDSVSIRIPENAEIGTTYDITYVRDSNCRKTKRITVIEMDEVFLEIIGYFNDYVTTDDEITLGYLEKLYTEAVAQYYGEGERTLPELYLEENFQNVYPNYFVNGNDTNLDTFKALVGWLFALQLSEILHDKRNFIFDTGYNIGGYNKSKPIFGYQFKEDPNVARLVAATIYAGMRGKADYNDEIMGMRNELGGRVYDSDLKLEVLSYLYGEELNGDGNRDFWIQLERFMATSPGPYQASNGCSTVTTTLPGSKTYTETTSQGVKSYTNNEVDENIYNYIVQNFNLDTSSSNYDRTVQAISDKEPCLGHIFGQDNVGSSHGYNYNAVFGNATLNLPNGKYFSTDSGTSKIAYVSACIGNASSKERNQIYNGESDNECFHRLRPGNSRYNWNDTQTYFRTTDGVAGLTSKNNILCNDEIELYDGCDYHECWANRKSYPSGHSSYVWGIAMLLMELIPDKANLILKAANAYAVNRTIVRYHWASDTVQGRVLSSTISSVCHAAYDFDSLLNLCKQEVQNII